MELFQRFVFCLVFLSAVFETMKGIYLIADVVISKLINYLYKKVSVVV